MQDTGAKKLVASGGGHRPTGLLRRELEGLCREHGLGVTFAPKLCVQVTMRLCVGSQGYYEWLAGHTAGMDLNACAAPLSGSAGGPVRKT